MSMATVRQWWAMALVAAATACDSGLFVEPALGPAEIHISYSLSETARLVAGGPSAAFDAADGLRIRILREDVTAVDTLIAFVPAEETRVALPVPSAAAGAVQVEVGVLNEDEALFVGSAGANLTRGGTTEVAVALDPVPHHVEIDRTIRRIGLGDTLFLGGSPAFATGHAISGALSWSANPADIVEIDPSSGRMIGKLEGATRVTGAFAGLEDTMTVTIRSDVESVSVFLPEEIEVDGSVVADARVVDRRGNRLVREIDWRSSNPGVATIDPDGRVQGVAAGEALITATVEGKSGEALLRVRECIAAPVPLDENAFRLSGVVARAGEVSVDVVLNPIIIEGKPVSGLKEGNFLVVEDGCQRPFTVTTSEGAVGIDLVFIQDLSGSMGGAILGVRTSVISFAEQLGALGLDIRIGSVGYSGLSDIPSTPAGSPSEYLGPVQDLTSPEEFRSHVESAWFASGGGDLPENGLEAVEYAHQNLSWRPGATRVMILITDVSLHWSGSTCSCSDQTIESIAELIGGSTVVHAVAPESEAARTANGGLDPWLLADATGGARLALGGDGTVDLNALEIDAVLAETIRLTFESATAENVPHDLRVRVTLPGGEQSEFTAEGIRYDPLEAELRAARVPLR